MIKIKLFFSLMILAILSLLVFGAVYEDNSENINIYHQISNITTSTYEYITYNYIINNRENLTCTINTTPESAIIFRIDDIQAHNKIDTSKKITEIILANGFSVVLGVIPNKIESDRKLVKWLKGISKNENVEIAQHGYEHTPEEFKDLDESLALKKIENGKILLISHLRIIPVTFIPPYNIQSDHTITALKSSKFYFLSGINNNLILGDNFSYIGYSARTWDFSKNEYVHPQESINSCKDDLLKNNICVIMIHPQDYYDYQNNSISQKEIEDLQFLINEIKKLDAKPSTFKDLLICEQY